jgi:hypothetical protein
MQERALATEPTEPSEHWMASELRFVRLAAQVEADEAYQDWRQHPGALAYAAYRARRIAPTLPRSIWPDG